MRSVCDKYNSGNQNTLGQYIAQEGHGFPQQVITPELRQVAATFIALYAAREKADYDDGLTVQHTEVLTLAQQAESAFQAWLTAQSHPSGTILLQECFAGASSSGRGRSRIPRSMARRRSSAPLGVERAVSSLRGARLPIHHPQQATRQNKGHSGTVGGRRQVP